MQNSLSIGGWKYACEVVKERYMEAGVSPHSHTIYSQMPLASDQEKAIT